MDTRLLPADSYVVVNKSIITEFDKKILNMLYLPIIGPHPIMLYNTLLNDLDKRENNSEEIEHAKLLSYLHISANELLSIRNSLEGIGLLKTYIKKDTINKYIYELYSPLSVHEFFSHPIFNVVLYNNVGKKEYDKLVTYFKISKINKDGYDEITKNFNEVFDMIPGTSYDIYNDNIRKYNRQKLSINSSFDIDLMIETMPENINKKIFAKDLQELIISLAYLYDIDVPKMQKIIQSCLNEKGTINRDDLRKVTRDHYQFDHGGLLPTMTHNTQPEYLRKAIGDNSKIARMIYTFETTSPYDFLKSKHNGAEPVKRDMQLLENLIIDYKLKPGVVNVLIDYVLRTQDNKLNRSYVESIAGTWSRKKIETVEEAMELARKTYKTGIKNIITKKQKPTTNTIPSWLDKDINIEEATDEERQEVENMLKEFR